MKKLMLHQASKLTEFRNITSQEIDAMHHAQDAPDIAFVHQDLSKYFARRFGVAVGPRDLPEAAREQILQLRAKIDMAFLGEVKRAHHLFRVFREKIAFVGVKLLVTAIKCSKSRLVTSAHRQETEQGTRPRRGIAARELLRNPLGTRKKFRGCPKKIRMNASLRSFGRFSR